MKNFMKKTNSGKSVEYHMSMIGMIGAFNGGIIASAVLIPSGFNLLNMIIFTIGICALFNQHSKVQWQLDDLRNKKYTGKSKRPQRHK